MIDTKAMVPYKVHVHAPMVEVKGLFLHNRLFWILHAKTAVPCKVHVHAPMVEVGLLADAGRGDATEEVLCCLALLEVADSATCPCIPLLVTVPADSATCPCIPLLVTVSADSATCPCIPLVTVPAGPSTACLTGALDSSEVLLTACPARSGVPVAGWPGTASVAVSLSACCSSFPGMSCSRSSAASNTVNTIVVCYRHKINRRCLALTKKGLSGTG